MAKRAPKSEKPYNPLDEALVRSVISGGAASPRSEHVRQGGITAVAELPREELEEPPSNVLSMPAAKSATRPVSSPRADLSYIDRRDREKRVLLTAAEERELDRLVERMATELRTRVKLSHVLRACYLVLMHAEDEILERARRAPAISRPGNGNAPELIAFEREIATVLAAAFRETTPLR
jgi:hypothetical protein